MWRQNNIHYTILNFLIPQGKKSGVSSPCLGWCDLKASHSSFLTKNAGADFHTLSSHTVIHCETLIYKTLLGILHDYWLISLWKFGEKAISQLYKNGFLLSPSKVRTELGSFVLSAVRTGQKCKLTMEEWQTQSFLLSASSITEVSHLFNVFLHNIWYSVSRKHYSHLAC